jgi:hypothetical protein
MGKKKRVLLNPKKFGKKHFEFLDNLDGTDDDIIRSSVVPLTIRTLNLVDNGDRTIKLSAELYGDPPGDPRMSYELIVTGGVATSISGNEDMEIDSTGSTGFIFASALPALKDNDGPIVLPTGKTTVRVTLVDNGAPGVPVLTFDEEVNVGAAPIGLTSTMLSGALQGQSGDSWDGSAALSINLDAMVGTGPQHGSGSGVGSTDTYNPKDYQHGYSISVSGAVNGLQTLTNSGSLNGHSDSGVLELLPAVDVEGLTPETLTITFTPLDVNDDDSSDEAVTFDITVID